MPVYPGDPIFRTKTAVDLETHGYLITELSFGTHTGTHVDAPSHYIKGGRSIDSFEADVLCGGAIVINCQIFSADQRAIDASVLKDVPPASADCSILLCATGWDTNWHSQDYFTSYPACTDNFITRAIGLGYSVLGFDTPSPDPPGKSSAHLRLLEKNILIVENLCGLKGLCASSSVQKVQVIALPLPIKDADASPITMLAKLA